jgi:hypothetical protein
MVTLQAGSKRTTNNVKLVKKSTKVDKIENQTKERGQQ